MFNTYPTRVSPQGQLLDLVEPLREDKDSDPLGFSLSVILYITSLSS